MCAARTPCRYLQKVDALPDPLVERRLAESIADSGCPQESEVDVSAALKRLDNWVRYFEFNMFLPDTVEIELEEIHA